LIFLSLGLICLIFPGFYLLGEKISSPWRPRLASGWEGTVFLTLTGLVGVSLITTLLAFLEWIYPISGWAILLGIYGSSVPSLRRWMNRFRENLPNLRLLPERKKKRDSFHLFCILALGFLIFLSLTLALAPPVRTDALVYHLAIPKAYLENHGFTNLPNSMYSFFPMLFNMVYLFTMTFGVEALPALVGLGTALLLLLALATYTVHHLGGTYRLLAPLLFFSTPTFLEISGSAYIDVPLAAFVFLTFYSWDRWRVTHENSWCIFMMVFAAAACATKLTAVIVVPLVILGIALEGRHSNHPGKVLARGMAFGLVLLCFMAPWWAKNYHYSGNPFMPLLMETFGGQGRINWDPTRAHMMETYVKWFGMGRGWQDFLKLPFNLTFFAAKDSLKFDGTIGVAYLLSLPFLLALWKSRSAQLRALGATFTILLVFWFINFQYVRFLTPSFALLSLVLALAWERTTRPKPSQYPRAPWKKILLAGLALAFGWNLYLSAEIWGKRNPLLFLSGQETRAEYLARNVPAFPMYEVMNRELPKDSKVLFVFMRNLGYLAERPFISDSVFEAHTLQKILKKDPSASGLPHQFRALGVTHLMFDRNYVFGPDAAFSPEERNLLRAYLKNNGHLIARKNGFFLYRFMLD